MGIYYHLACTQCGCYVHFGKKLHRDGTDILQGMYSEKLHAWIDDDRVWHGLQCFLFQHTGHTLVFDNDDHNSTIDDYLEIEFDELTTLVQQEPQTGKKTTGAS